MGSAHKARKSRDARFGQDFIALEEQGWLALSTGGEAAKALYGLLLADDMVMVFPGEMLLDWIDFRLSELSHLHGARAVWVADCLSQRVDVTG